MSHVKKWIDGLEHRAYTFQNKEGTKKIYTYLKESDMADAGDFTDPACELVLDDPRVEALVTELIGRVADKWTMLILEVLEEKGPLRFTRLGELVDGISQKMLTQTLRQMERDGLLIRTMYPVIPPHVDYRLSPLGQSLGAAFCGVWTWAAEHLAEIDRARQEFDQRQAAAQHSIGRARRSDSSKSKASAQKPKAVHDGTAST